jgi:hypothetical protein
MPQFLRAHEAMEFFYSVADVSYPVSIRDQMNRARWLVDKAHDLGFFGPKRDEKYRRLLVCGAGAVGATASLHAQSLGIQTVLVERRTRFHSELGRRRSRNPRHVQDRTDGRFWNGAVVRWLR